MNIKRYDLAERAQDFAAEVGRLCNRFPENKVLARYTDQLVRSSSSISANIEEADGTLTKKDFIHKMGIARREARESRHWLVLIYKTFIIPRFNKDLLSLSQEARELLLILSSIINKVQNR